MVMNVLFSFFPEISTCIEISCAHYWSSVAPSNMVPTSTPTDTSNWSKFATLATLALIRWLLRWNLPNSNTKLTFHVLTRDFFIIWVFSFKTALSSSNVQPLWLDFFATLFFAWKYFTKNSTFSSSKQVPYCTSYFALSNTKKHYNFSTRCACSKTAATTRYCRQFLLRQLLCLPQFERILRIR
jgi:hypothetical protein